MEGPCADKNMRPWARASPRLCLARRHSQRCLLFISAVCLLQTGGLPTPFPSWVEIRAADRPSRPTPLYLPRCPGNHTTPTVTKQPWLGWIPRLHAAGVRTSVCKWILCYAMLCVCVSVRGYSTRQCKWGLEVKECEISCICSKACVICKREELLRQLHVYIGWNNESFSITQNI